MEVFWPWSFHLPHSEVCVNGGKREQLRIKMAVQWSCTVLQKVSVLCKFFMSWPLCTDFAMYSGLREVRTNSHQHASHLKPILTQLWIEPNSPLTSGFTLVTYSKTGVTYPRIGQVGSYQCWQVIERTPGYW